MTGRNDCEGDRFPSTGVQCPLPLRDYPQIVLGHGGGGQLSDELVRHLFLPSFANDALQELGDASVVALGEQRIAFCTDSFVVQPRFFPGGNIGELAVNGTVNDLAMVGAEPKWLSAAFILEEGFSMDELARIVAAMADAAARAGVDIVTGDTKVVPRGQGDGCYINTSGIGVVPKGIVLCPSRVQVGDAILLSGTIADHGMAIMSVREGLGFESEIASDTAALHELVATMLGVCPEIRAMRDPTRGGVAAALHEVAQAAQVGIEIDDAAVPIAPATASACEILGIDPLAVANEGKLIAFVPDEAASEVLEAMRAHPLGHNAARIGKVVADHRGMVVAKTAIGATRVITTQIGEALPRIC